MFVTMQACSMNERVRLKDTGNMQYDAAAAQN
jgi:hypothetical protein